MPSAPYDIVQSAMNLASVRVNDAMKQAQGAPAGQIGGEITGAQQIFAKTTVNGAWRKMQEFLTSPEMPGPEGAGPVKLPPFPSLVNTTKLLGLAPVATTDPGTNCYLDWTGYFDGVTLQATPFLPQDFTTPLRLKERVSGQTGTAEEFTPMEYVNNGLTGTLKRNRNYNWAWDNNRLIFPGSTSAMDLEVRYISFLADFEDAGSPLVPWYEQPIPIMRALDAFAWYIALEYSAARGDIDLASMAANAEAAALRLIQREAQNDQLRSEWVIPAIPGATGATPYDTVNTILNSVKTRLNALSRTAADVMISNQPYMQQCFNTGYRRCQAFLANLGYIKFTKEVILTGLEAKVSNDPAVQVMLDWSGYSNGTTLDPAIALPQDLILPLRVWQRPTGQNAEFSPMGQWLDGLESQPAQPFNSCWEWRGDALFMPGANGQIDLRVRYACYLPDLTESGSPVTPWYEQPVPIVRVLDSLSQFVCAEISVSRPDLELDTQAFITGAEAAAKLIFNRDARQKQRTTIRRLSRSGRLEGNAGWGGQGSW